MSFPMSPSGETSDTSCDDLDLSILKQVKVAINNVADTQQAGALSTTSDQAGHHSSSDGSLSLDRLQVQCEECLAKISVLEKEVHLLEDEVLKSESPLEDMNDKHLQEALMSLLGSHLPDDNQTQTSGQINANTRSEVKILKSRIALNESLTGIRFKSVNWEITRTDKDGLFRKYDHIGVVHGFNFHTQFIVREEKNSDSASSQPMFAHITGLRVEVDARLEKELLHFITKSTTECDLMKFYKTYSQFCLCVKQRRKSFKAAQVLHNKCVQISDTENRLQFSLGDKPNLDFMWDVHVSVDGMVRQSLELQTKILPNTYDKEREHLGRLPQLLQRMTKLYGYREAVLRTLNILNPSV